MDGETVAPEMIKAGLAQLPFAEPDPDDWHEIVASIYRAMRAVAEARANPGGDGNISASAAEVGGR